MPDADIATSLEAVLDGAANDLDREILLRQTHRLALQRLAQPSAESHRDFERWKQEERRAWLLAQALNERQARARLDIVDLGEEIDAVLARFEGAR